MNVTCITPTGDRPEAFELCRRWIFSQTKQPTQWLVVDDGFTPLPDSSQKGIEYIRRKPDKGEGNTLTKNLRVLLPFIKYDKILIIEDDDWYGPDYIKTMSNYLNNHVLVGEGCARYYHVPTLQYRRIANTKHASLCQTGFHKSILPEFEKCLDGDPYVDSRLWSRLSSIGFLFFDTDDKLRLHCSTKGLKGRRGIGTGHEQFARYYNPDCNLKYFLKWVGEENVRIYLEHVGQSFESALLIGEDYKRRRNRPLVIIPRKKRRLSPPPPPPPPPQKDISVITLTGDRPVSFNFLRIWMEKQTIKPKQWIVVDDGETPLLLSQQKDCEYYRREPTSSDYTHTLCLNLLVALGKVRYDKIIVMEDDDWYSSIYIEYMSKLLNDSDLVGFKRLLFYYPALSMYMEKASAKQPAFAQTAFSSSIIPVLQNICFGAGKDFDLCGKGLVDIKLWKDPLDIFKKEESVRLTTSLKTANGAVLRAGTVFKPPVPYGIMKRALRKQGAEIIIQRTPVTAKKTTLIIEDYLTVGMKGMPGRKGLTTAHNQENKKYKKDEDYKLLKSILKEDVKFYLELFT